MEILKTEQKDHSRVLERIFRFYQGDVARHVTINPSLDNEGCLGRTNFIERGKWQIQLSDTVAKKSFVTLGKNGEERVDIPLGKISLQYLIFLKTLGRGNSDDFFDHVIGHEYGHVIFNEVLVSSILNKMEINVSNYGGRLPLKLLDHSEAFAYWFSDNVIGVKEPWLFCGRNISKDNSQLKRQGRLYHSLWKMTEKNGKGSAFDTGLLMDAFYECDPNLDEIMAA